MARNNHDIETRRDVITTKNLSDQTLRAISDNCAAQPLRRGNPKPSDSQTVRLGEQRVIPARNPGAVCVNVLEIGVPADSLARPKFQQPLFVANRKTLAAFRATTLQNKTAVLRAHAHQEPMRPLSPASVRLECALALHASLQEPKSSVRELAIVANAFCKCQCTEGTILRALC
jgi:hypothetical protein